VINRAAAAYELELKKPAKFRRGSRAIAKDFEKSYFESTGVQIKIHHTTVAARAAGRKSRKEAAQAQEWLLPEEAELVIKHVTQCADQGFSLTHRRLKEDVDQILGARLGDDFPEEGIGKNWTHRFVERNSDRL
ncbi:hypothetical protein FA15DRAFT_555840, partial [Coprinopsis marcescibilis]